jgi:hypothetical protein
MDRCRGGVLAFTPLQRCASPVCLRHLPLERLEAATACEYGQRGVAKVLDVRARDTQCRELLRFAIEREIDLHVEARRQPLPVAGLQVADGD